MRGAQENDGHRRDGGRPGDGEHQDASEHGVGEIDPPGEEPPPAELPPPDDPYWHTGFLVVRLREGLPDSRADDLETLARELDLPDLLRELERLDRPPTRRLITTIPPEELLRDEQSARETDSPFAPLDSLTRYWRIDLRAPGRRDLSEIADRLQGSRDVDLAYPELLALEPGPPPPKPADLDPWSAEQQFEADPLDGIGARRLWGLEPAVNGTGRGVGFADVERGWRLAHEDIRSTAPRQVFGAPTLLRARDHGTSVLGIVVSPHNGVGGVGLAPGASPVLLSSHYSDEPIDQPGPGNRPADRTAEAITHARRALGPGDVLLLEVTVAGLPAEKKPDVVTAVRTAVAKGIVVVEAAGNADLDLEQQLPALSAPDGDSGAIVVGAATASAPHDRLTMSDTSALGSCYGSRVDCFAWGERIVTATSGVDPSLVDLSTVQPATADTGYTTRFGGTSGASAIIAGAAVLLQGLHRDRTGSVLLPGPLRRALRDPKTGTPQGIAVPGAIGVMPDLPRVAEALLGPLF